MRNIMTDKKKPDLLRPTHIVGIGASAGGLEAIEAFFKNIPADTGLSFIVIQHLSPDYKSLMVELLSKKTLMTVMQAQNGLEVKPDYIYLIPPKKALTIFHNKLILKDLKPTGGINLPIDTFFISLAEDAAERSIAIVLSGTGSDGTRGVRAVKEHNGMVMVQDEESAKFDGMPRAAASTGAADFILAPSRMPEQLLAFVKHPFESRHNPLSVLEEDGDSLSTIFAELRNRTKVDFSLYKKNTIIRRLERRIAINNTADIDEYLNFLHSNPGETIALYKELLIGVTNFFRDPEAMQEIMNIHLPELFRQSGRKEFRFWIAGCSTGEEAYTMAIIAKEAMEKIGISADVKIFATDIDKNAIQKAGTGIYPESIAADLNPKLIGKYFYKKEDNYQIVRNIREMVVFANHNLIKDPPFTNIDFVSCRNLLIYLQPVLQKKAMEMFNYSLNENGLLFLGSSETVGDMIEYFEPLNHKHKIYYSKGISNRSNIGEIKPITTETSKQVLYKHREKANSWENILLSRFMDVMTDKYITLAVIVNSKLEIQHTFGETEGFFKIPTGKPNYEIPRITVKELSIPLSTGIQKVFRSGQEMTYSNINMSNFSKKKSITLKIVPLPQKKGQEPLVVVFFEATDIQTDERNISDSNDFNMNDEAMQRIRDLESELQFSNENLQATIEELETSNEELQATNEELLASNEELQSTNEELQSTNEELYTVNAEYQNKITELTELNNDVENLLTSSHIGKLLVDENLEIRKFSPETSMIFSILEQDIGRPISHLTHNIKNFDLMKAIKKVTSTKTIFEKRVELRDNSVYIIRILPYHIGPKIFSGLVLTFINITDIEETRERLEDSLKINAEIIEKMPAGFYVYKLDENNELFLEKCNPEAEKMTGKNKNEIIGKSFDELWPKAKASGLTDKYIDVVKTGKSYQGIDIYEDDKLKGSFRVQAFPLPENRLAIGFENMSSLLEVQEKLEMQQRQYVHLFKEMSQGVVYQTKSGEIISANPAAERILGLSISQMQGKTSMDESWRAVNEDGTPLPGEEHPAMVCIRTGKPVFNFIMGVYNPKTESMRWILINSKPVQNKDETFQVFTTFEDITDKKIRDEKLKQTAEILEITFQASGLAWWQYNLQTGKVNASVKKGEILGYKNLDEEQNLDFWLKFIHPDDYNAAMDAMRDHIEGRKSEYRITYRMKCKNGEYLKLLDRGKIVEREEGGKPIKLLGDCDANRR